MSMQFIEMQENQTNLKDNRIIMCLFRGLIVWMYTYSLLSCFTKAFELAFNSAIVYSVILVLSIAFSLFYYNNWTRNLGWIAMFFIFLFVTMNFATYAGSGFNAILNDVMKKFSDVFDLSGTRQFNEIFSDRYATITICLIVISAASVFFVTYSVNTAMHYGRLLFAAIIIVSFGLYIEVTPNGIDIMMLFVSILCMVVMRRSKHYAFDRRLESYQEKEKKEYVQYSFFTNAKASFQTAGIVTGSVLLLVLMSSIIMPKNNLVLPKDFTILKDSADVVVKEVVQNGLFSLFAKATNIGGIENGQLGNVGAVYPQGIDCIQFQYPVLNMDPMYFKQFVGGDYEGREWTSNFSMEKDHAPQADYLRYFYENGSENVEKIKISMQGLIPAINADALYPYIRGMEIDANSRYDVYLLDNNLYSSQNNFSDLMLRYNFLISTDGKTYIENEMIGQTYYHVPSQTVRELNELFREIDIDPLSEVDEKIEKIIDYLTNHYQYSLNPGKTPRNKDFVSYFLLEQKKGYCVHFASAATILFRMAGVRARYCEGFVSNYDDMVEADTIADANLADWIDNYDDTTQAIVLDITLTDTSAHAWVEVYDSIYGWKPVEVTLANWENEERESNLIDFLELFQFNSNLTLGTNDAVNKTINATMSIMRTTAFTGAVLAIVIVVIMLVFFFVHYMAMPYGKSIYTYYKADYNDKIIIQYQQLNRRIGNIPLHEEMENALVTRYYVVREKAEAYIALMRQISYSNKQLEKAEYEKAKVLSKEIKQTVQKNKRKVAKECKELNKHEKD